MNLVEQRAAVAVVLSLLVLVIAVTVQTSDEPEPLDALHEPSLFVTSTSHEPIVLLEVRIAGASVLGAPRVLKFGERLTLRVTGDGVQPPWRVRWLHAGRLRHTRWSGGLRWFQIAGPYATTPIPAPCVIGGGEELRVAWDPRTTPRREVTLEADDYLAPPHEDWQ